MKRPAAKKKKTLKAAPLARLSKKTRLLSIALFAVVASVVAYAVFAAQPVCCNPDIGICSPNEQNCQTNPPSSPKAGDQCIKGSKAPEGFSCDCQIGPSCVLVANAAGTTPPTQTNPKTTGQTTPPAATATPTGSCAASHSFFFFPSWYKYLADAGDLDQNCNLNSNFHFPGDLWLIGLAILDILLRLAGFAAVISIIIAGAQYIFAGGNPETAASARKRIWNSVIGLGIAIVATAAVTFVGNQIK